MTNRIGFAVFSSSNGEKKKKKERKTSRVKKKWIDSSRFAMKRVHLLGSRERERENLSPSSSSSFLFDGEYFTLIVCVYMYLWVEHTQNIRSNICLSSAILFGCRRRRKFFFFASFFFLTKMINNAGGREDRVQRERIIRFVEVHRRTSGKIKTKFDRDWVSVGWDPFHSSLRVIFLSLFLFFSLV